MKMEDRISSVISAFDSQGWHRTGTAVDAASASWFAAEVGRTGALASIETYRFTRLVPRESFIEVDGRRIEAVPLFDSTATPPEGVTAPLGAGPSRIALVAAAPGGHSPELDDLRNSGAPGVVIVTTAQRPGIAPRNANDFRRPFGTPALQVAGESLADLEAARASGSAVRLVSTFDHEDTVASNVVGVVAGRDPAAPPLCVMTPRSGWWDCASERGGGIACLLELARALAQAAPRRTVIFVGTTGHELGHWGLEEFLFRRPGLDTGAVLWIHFGASVGAAMEPRTSVFASRPALKDEALRDLEAAGAALPTRSPDGAIAGGESRNIHAAGGQYVSLAGGSAVFHLQQDRWPAAVDVQQVAAVARAMTNFALRVANS